MQWIDGVADDVARATRNAANPSQSWNETSPRGAEKKYGAGKQLECNTQWRQSNDQQREVQEKV